MNCFFRKHKTIIQYFSLIMFICGMCWHLTEADSFLSYKEVTTTTSTLTSLTNTNHQSELCTAEMLGQKSTFRTSLPCSSSDNKIILKYHFYFFIPHIQIALGSFSLLFFLFLPSLFLKCSSLDIIISYIHSKDGKKSPLFF